MKLAIKGHSTRYKEVIELLEMLGGCDSGYSGGGMKYYYYISQFGNIEGSCEPYEFDTYIIYTLEEFLKKYPFKVGDKVFLYDNITEGYVTGMKWDEDKGTVKYCVYTSEECWCDVKELFKWNIIDLIEKHYKEQCDNMDKTMFMIGHTLVPNKVDNNLEYEIIDGYEFDRVDNNKIILKPIKPKYPTTYEDCCKIKQSDPNFYIDTHLYSNKLGLLYKLLICRDAYWKIAGEQMGLGKPWGPDWNDLNRKYFISLTCDGIGLYDDFRNPQILAFPTKEMRDVFYENFKELIEECKELL